MMVEGISHALERGKESVAGTTFQPDCQIEFDLQIMLARERVDATSETELCRACSRKRGEVGDLCDEVIKSIRNPKWDSKIEKRIAYETD